MHVQVHVDTWLEKEIADIIISFIQTGYTDTYFQLQCMRVH